MKLPKQWPHWCRQAGLRPRRSRSWLDKRKQYTWLYLHGHGREWRVNCHHILQCGDRYEDFDRWALCDIAEAPMPTSRDEFVATVKALLVAHEAGA